ncbi:hypothetical protein [Burkholderia cepacia]|uniref:hypothetical protein n=1 Tax=Burkholderia cepacia TaxID=292 RepID=UPI00075EC4FE|nr:hypothetical protein [Burkholderia cepacia]KVH58504.1 hypothetical protein WJ40_26480 [Burkholderia cepacia]KVS72686.1 hypothetical protein WK41_14010 [Burkholderia cepacia]
MPAEADAGCPGAGSARCARFAWIRPDGWLPKMPCHAAGPADDHIQKKTTGDAIENPVDDRGRLFL